MIEIVAARSREQDAFASTGKGSSRALRDTGIRANPVQEVGGYTSGPKLGSIPPLDIDVSVQLVPWVAHTGGAGQRTDLPARRAGPRSRRRHRRGDVSRQDPPGRAAPTARCAPHSRMSTGCFGGGDARGDLRRRGGTNEARQRVAVRLDDATARGRTACWMKSPHRLGSRRHLGDARAIGDSF
jgi:hypothetical protein